MGQRALELNKIMMDGRTALRVKPHWSGPIYYQDDEIEQLCRELQLLFPDHFTAAAAAPAIPGEEESTVETR